MKVRSLLFFLLCSCFIALGQSGDWYHFNTFNHFRDFVRDGDDLWAITTDGLIRLNLPTSGITKYDRTHPMIQSGQMHGMARLGGGGGIVIVTYDFGLLEIHGDNFQYHNSNNSGLPADDLLSVATDPSGDVWMSCQSSQSVIKYDGLNWTEYPLPYTVTADYGLYLTAGADGKIWVGTNTRLLDLDNGVWTDHTSEMQQAGCFANSVNTIFEDSEGNLWLSASGLVYRFDGTNWDLVFFSSGNADIAEDDEGTVCISSSWGMNGELFQYINDTIVQFAIGAPDFPDPGYFALYSEPDGTLWMGGDPGGIVGLKNGTTTWYPIDPEPFSDTRQYDLATDLAGNPWILTPTHVRGFVGQQWLEFEHPGFIGTKLRVIDPDRFFVMSNSSAYPKLTYYYFGEWLTFDDQAPNFFFPEDISLKDMEVDSEGTLWLLAADALYRLSGGDWTRFDATNSTGFPSTTLWRLAIDPQDGVWISDLYGENAFKFNGSGLTPYPNPHPSSWFHTQMETDPSGKIWFYSAGVLMKLNDSGFTTVSAPAFDPLYMKPYGDGLVFSENGAIGIFDGSAITRFTPSNSPLRVGLPGELAVTAAADIWISNNDNTQGGLSIYNPNGVAYSTATTAIDPGLVAALVMTLFPNPATDAAFIRVNLPESAPVQIELFDLAGRKLRFRDFGKAAAGSNEFPLNLEGLASGMYVITLRAGQTAASLRLIRQ
jgi:streptogramin lyase